MRLQQRHQALIPRNYKTLPLFSLHSLLVCRRPLLPGCIGVMAPAKFVKFEILVMVVLGGMGSMFGFVVSCNCLTMPQRLHRAFADYRMVALS